jgi:hypothetical protein
MLRQTRHIMCNEYCQINFIIEDGQWRGKWAEIMPKKW